MKTLFREDLLKNHYEVRLDENGDPHVYHFGKLKRNSKEGWHEIKTTKVSLKHPYGVDREYLAVTLTLDGFRTTVSFGRIVYAFLKGEIPYGMDVDHIDSNPFNNKPENLQCLTRRENLAKRYNSHSQIALKWNQIKRSKQYEK